MDSNQTAAPSVPLRPDEDMNTRQRTRAIAMTALVEQGELVGASRVRQIIGHGGLGIINDELKKFRIEAAENMRAGYLRVACPEPVQELAGELITKLWEKSYEIATGLFAAEKEALQLSKELSERTAAEAVELQHELTIRLDGALERCALLETALADQRLSLDQARDEVARLTQSLAETVESHETKVSAMVSTHERQVAALQSEVGKVSAFNELLKEDLANSIRVSEEEMAKVRSAHANELRERDGQAEIVRRKSANLSAELTVNREALVAAQDRIAELEDRERALQSKLANREAKLDEMMERMTKALERGGSASNVGEQIDGA